MKSKLASFIMSTVIILIISVCILFGIILFHDIDQTNLKSQNITSTMAENEHFNKNTINKNTNDENENADGTIADNNNINKNNNNNIIDNNIKNEENADSTVDPFEEIIKNKAQSDNIQYTTISIDKYFYNQLEDYSKIIYEAFETNKEQMKTGNYKIELGNSFNNILQQSNGQEILGTYYQSAIEAYTYDNPDVFYLDPNKMYLNIETITRGQNITYNVYINAGDKNNYFIDEFSSKAQIDNALRNINQVKDNILQYKTSNSYNNIKMVHDYLIENTQYDTSISKPNIYNMYGALINRECVCEGYARSFKYLMDELRHTMHNC